MSIKVPNVILRILTIPFSVVNVYHLHSQAKEKREAVETLAGQTQKFGLEWQKSDKSGVANPESKVLTPLFLGN